MNLLRPLRLCALLATSLLAMQAQATPVITVDLDFTGFALGYRNGTVTDDGDGRRVSAGLFSFEVSNPVGHAPWDWGQTLEAFCVELGTQLNQNRVTYTLVQATDYFDDASRVDLMGRLYTGFRDAVVDEFTSAGFQLALWELVEEDTDTLNLNRDQDPNGSFRTNWFGSGRLFGNEWLRQLDDLENQYNLYVLQAEGTQDLLVFSPDLAQEIAEPASLGLLGLGLAVLGVRGRRRR